MCWHGSLPVDETLGSSSFLASTYDEWGWLPIQASTTFFFCFLQRKGYMLDNQTIRQPDRHTPRFLFPAKSRLLSCSWTVSTCRDSGSVERDGRRCALIDWQRHWYWHLTFDPRSFNWQLAKPPLSMYYVYTCSYIYRCIHILFGVSLLQKKKEAVSLRPGSIPSHFAY